MNYKLTISAIGLYLLLGNVFSQNVNLEKALSAQSGSLETTKNSFFDPGKYSDLLKSNLNSIFPDSIITILPDNHSSRTYYILTNNILSVKSNCNFCYRPSIIDNYYYSDKGNLDSAIVVAEADAEYDEYTVKHTFFYNNNHLETEKIYSDITDDSVANDWRLWHYKIFTSDGKSFTDFYGSEQGFRTKSTYSISDSNAKGFTRTDSLYSNNGDNIRWKPEGFTVNKIDSTGIDSRHYQISSIYPDSLGYYQRDLIAYDSKGNITSKITYYLSDGISIYTGTKEEYEYDAKGSIIQKNIYGQNSDKSWAVSTQSMYYYSKSSAMTKIKDTQNVEISFYPNPAHDFIHVKGIYEGFEATIYNIDGKLIKTQRCSDNNISIGNVPNGFYFLKISSKNNKTLNHPFVKQ